MVETGSWVGPGDSYLSLLFGPPPDLPPNPLEPVIRGVQLGPEEGEDELEGDLE